MLRMRSKDSVEEDRNAGFVGKLQEPKPLLLSDNRFLAKAGDNIGNNDDRIVRKWRDRIRTGGRELRADRDAKRLNTAVNQQCSGNNPLKSLFIRVGIGNRAEVFVRIRFKEEGAAFRKRRS